MTNLWPFLPCDYIFVNNVKKISNQMKPILYIYTLCEKIICVIKKHVTLWTL